MSLIGAQHGLVLGYDYDAANAANGHTTFAMAALNTGWCAIDIAKDTRDYTSVTIEWNTVTAAGTVTLRIETIDATTGKPTGSLYDANATKAFTPVLGKQVITFASQPTAGRTAGNAYAILLITTTGGTTHALRSHVSSNLGTGTPFSLLTAADATTRSNLTFVNNGQPCLTATMEDGLEEHGGWNPYTNVGTYNIYGTIANGAEITVPNGTSFVLSGIDALIGPTGTPAGDLRARILTSADAAVSGTTVTLDKDSCISAHTVRGRFFFPFAANVTLLPGVYKVVIDSSGSANSSNCWTMRSGQANTSASVASGCIQISTADVTAGTISWTRTTTEAPAVGLPVESVTGFSGRIIDAKSIIAGVL